MSAPSESKLPENAGGDVLVSLDISPKPVVAAAPPVTDNSEVAPIQSQPVLPGTPPPPETFTVGVTDVMFNATNAIFGRLLHTVDGHVVTLAYWEQKENVAHDEIPYFENINS